MIILYMSYYKTVFMQLRVPYPGHIPQCYCQCFGSGSGLDPDSIRSMDPYPDSEFGSGSGSRRAKMAQRIETN
jgi:hypothetical protein